MSDKARLEALTKMFMEEFGDVAPARPRLTLVGAAPRVADEDDPVTRQCRLNRIRWLSKAFRLGWLVDQHCFGLAGPDCLDHRALEALHRDMERARACAAEGISYEDAGLIRSNYQEAI